MRDDSDLDDDWRPVSSAGERDQLEAELPRELSPTHILKGLGAVPVGRRVNRDDVLFRLEDGRYAQVHLTWRHEPDPCWPSTDIYPTFEAWKAIPPEDR